MQLDKDAMIEFRDQGLSCTEVSKRTGVSLSVVYGFCKRNGITLKKGRTGGRNVIDMTGREFGSLVVIERAEPRESDSLAWWLCACKCGGRVVRRGSDLRQGKIKTCGCRIGIKSRRNWQGHGNIPKSYWKTVNENASRRGLSITVTIEEINSLYDSQKGVCNLSGTPLSFKNKTASLDRIDSRVGYVAGNLQWIHKDINRMKQSFSQKRFLELCAMVSVWRGDVRNAA